MGVLEVGSMESGKFTPSAPPPLFNPHPLPPPETLFWQQELLLGNGGGEGVDRGLPRRKGSGKCIRSGKRGCGKWVKYEKLHNTAYYLKIT